MSQQEMEKLLNELVDITEVYNATHGLSEDVKNELMPNELALLNEK